MNKFKIIAAIFAAILFFNVVFSCTIKGCKDIVACGDSTAGDYNLLLKVRDPSRPGLQVLCIVPEGYEYTYHHPWTGKHMVFETKHKFIGLATKNDTIPNMVKAGMTLSDSGIAFGDADTNSNWKNPTRYAWDDFDWIRYACEIADNEDDAVSLMTIDLVDKMHATGVSENLFVVGPNSGYVVEADAFHYDVKEVNDGVVVMSNYPKELWRTQIHKKLLIASSFDIEKEEYVRKGEVISLNSLYCVRIVDVGENSIVARQIPFFKIIDGKILKRGTRVKIDLGNRKTVGDFSVELLDIDDNKARIKLCYKFKAWEDEVMKHIQPRYGSISVSDMINWSRLHREDLNGLRPMCEDIFSYEAVAIYKIPKQNYEKLSSGWFAANHACSSIYVPFHICDDAIFDPYETSEAAELSFELLGKYGHSILTDNFSKVEEVFLYETEVAENKAKDMIANNLSVSEFLTVIDTGMQEQAWLTQQMWMEASNICDQKNKQEIMDIISDIWVKNYASSLEYMETAIHDLTNVSESEYFIDKIEGVVLSICELRNETLEMIEPQGHLVGIEHEADSMFVKQGAYSCGDVLTGGQLLTDLSVMGAERNEMTDPFPDAMSVFLTMFFMIIVFEYRPE